MTEGVWVMSTQMADDHVPPSGSMRPVDVGTSNEGPPPLPRTTRAGCQVHNTHQPISHINEIHHVWPLGHGGPDIPANTVVTCATGHNSMHDLLGKWIKAGGDPGWEVLRHYTREERRLAQIGWNRIQWQGMDRPAETL